MTDLAAAPTMRRALLTDSGEPLYAPCPPVEAAIRFAAFSEVTGVPTSALLTTPLVSVPLPLYQAEWPEGRRRWEGVKPEAMWHPLLWLPERVARPYTIVAADNSTHLETPDAWALRVALEVSTCGLYDEATGTWMDVLAMVGLDADDDLDVARVEEWLDGSPDELLDSIDLSVLLDVEGDEDWAVHEVHGGIEAMWTVAYASSAEHLLDLAASVAESLQSGTVEIDEARRSVARIAGLAASTFWRIGTTGAVEEGGEVPPFLWEWDSLLDQIMSFDGSPDDLADDQLAEIVERLQGIYDIYMPAAVELAGPQPDSTDGEEANDGR